MRVVSFHSHSRTPAEHLWSSYRDGWKRGFWCGVVASCGGAVLAIALLMLAASR